MKLYLPNRLANINRLTVTFTAIALVFVNLMVPTIVFSEENMKELVLEKTISLPNPADIKNVVMAETEDGKAMYAAVILREEGLEFLNDNGTRKSYFPYPQPYGKETSIWTHPNQNEKFISVHVTIAHEGVGDKDEVIVFNTKGERVWSVPTKSYGSHELDPTGKYFVVLPPNVAYPMRPPAFLTANGIINKHVNNNEYALGDQWYPSGESAGIQFKEDGTEALVPINNVSIREDSVLTIFSSNGIKTGEIKVNTFSLRNPLYIDSNKAILLPFRNKEETNILIQAYHQKSHSIIWETKLPFMSAVFSAPSEKDRQLFLASGRLNYFLCLNLDSGNEIWRYKDPFADDYSYKSLISNGQFLIASGYSRENISKGSQVVVFSARGEKIAYRKYPQGALYESTFEHKLSVQKGRIYVLKVGSVDVLLLPES